MLEFLQTYGIGTIAVVLTFGLAVFVHEFGHMFFALVRGVGVESFAIGMGPKICSWVWHGIDFSLRWFPVGGFVKLKGMVPEETPAAVSAAAANGHEPDEDGQPAKTVSESSYDDLLALSNKGLVTKLMVFGGGVFMNYVTAIVAMVLFLMLPKQFPEQAFIVHKLEPADGVTLPDLRPGDRVTALNGATFEYFHQFEQKIEDLLDEAARTQHVSPDAAVSDFTLTVEREGQSAAVPLGRLDKTGLENILKQTELRQPPIVGIMVPTKPAEKAGIQTGDMILAVDGAPVNSFNEMVDIVNAGLGPELVIRLQHGKETKEVKVTPEPGIEDPKLGMIGIMSGAAEKYTEPGMPIGESILTAPSATWKMLKFLVVAQYDFFKHATFTQIKDNLGGPIMIAGVTQRAARRGFADSVQWFITLNLLLMVFNLLPLPVLDGGFIVISVIEAVIRRPIPPQVIAPIYTAFVVLFIGLMVVISVLDVKRWFF